MFGNAKRADLMSIERPRRKRVSSIETMMRALRLEEEQLDIASDESFDSSSDNTSNVGNPHVVVKHGSNEIRRSKSTEDTRDVRRRILTESLATAKTVRKNKVPRDRAKSLEPIHLSLSAKCGDSVHESIMASIVNDKAAISDEESEGSTAYRDSRDSLHELTMEIIRNEHAERSRIHHSSVRRSLSGLKVPSAVFESSKFIEEDGLMVLKTRSIRKNHRHADKSSSFERLIHVDFSLCTNVKYSGLYQNDPELLLWKRLHNNYMNNERLHNNYITMKGTRTHKRIVITSTSILALGITASVIVLFIS